MRPNDGFRRMIHCYMVFTWVLHILCDPQLLSFPLLLCHRKGLVEGRTDLLRAARYDTTLTIQIYPNQHKTRKRKVDQEG